MEIKTQKPVKVLGKTISTTLNNIKQDAGQTPEQLYEIAASNNMTPAGPQYWRYIGADSNRDTVFSLDMTLPVAGTGIPVAPYSVMELPEFKYVSMIHGGSWDNLSDTYGKLIGGLMAQGHKLSRECREVYINVDEANPANNLTEVQVGIL